MLKVELHAHSADDPVDRIPYSSTQLIDRAADLGFGALAITLHERELPRAVFRRLTAHAAERGVVLIPGVERSIGGKHVLLLNFRAGAEDVDTFDDLARLKAADPGGLVIAPHPFFPLRSCLGRLLEQHAALFDAVEWNAMFTTRINFNRRAAQWAARHGRPLVGNGDVHRLHQLGKTFSTIDAEPIAEAICEAVREGRVQVEARPLSLTQAVLTVGSLLWEDGKALSGVMSSEKAEDCPCPRPSATASLRDSAPSSASSAAS